tara:strand:+ start:34 stop:411 length:378 start_codon:yes stop_codon:yes gene_type:complete
MEIKLDTVRTTLGVKHTLNRLKQLTGIETWNVLCRCAFCLSIKQENLPREIEETLDGVEIDYEVFVGKNRDIYTQLLINNLLKYKIEINKRNLSKYLYAHINRGVNIMYSNKLKDISGLMALTNS